MQRYFGVWTVVRPSAPPLAAAPAGAAGGCITGGHAAAAAAPRPSTRGAAAQLAAASAFAAATVARGSAAAAPPLAKLPTFPAAVAEEDDDDAWLSFPAGGESSSSELSGDELDEPDWSPRPSPICNDTLWEPRASCSPVVRAIGQYAGATPGPPAKKLRMEAQPAADAGAQAAGAAAAPKQVPPQPEQQQQRLLIAFAAACWELEDVICSADRASDPGRPDRHVASLYILLAERCGLSPEAFFRMNPRVLLLCGVILQEKFSCTYGSVAEQRARRCASRMLSASQLKNVELKLLELSGWQLRVREEDADALVARWRRAPPGDGGRRCLAVAMGCLDDDAGLGAAESETYGATAAAAAAAAAAALAAEIACETPHRFAPDEARPPAAEPSAAATSVSLSAGPEDIEVDGGASGDDAATDGDYGEDDEAALREAERRWGYKVDVDWP